MPAAPAGGSTPHITGPAQTLSPAEFEQVVPARSRLYRGVTSVAGAAHNREGNLGGGDYGRGIYFSRQIGHAQSYSQRFSGDDGGRILRAGIRPGANIATPPRNLKQGRNETRATAIDRWAEENSVDVVDEGNYQIVRNPAVLIWDEHDYTGDQAVVLDYRATGYTLDNPKYDQAKADIDALMKPRTAPAAPAGRTPHHPALTGEDPMIPAGANRVGMNIVDFDEETGRTIGHLFLPGYAPDGGDSELRVHQDRGGMWVADELPGGLPDQSARDPHALLAKVARLYSITGTGKVEDERDNVRRNLSGTRPLPATAAPAPAGPKRGSIEAKIEAKQKEIERRVGAVSLAREARSNTGARIQSGRESKANAALSNARRELAALQEEQRRAATPVPAAMPDPVSTEMRERLANFTPEERDQLRAEAQELRTARGETPAGAWRAVIESAEQDRLSGTGRYARTAPAARPAGVGPGAVAIGATDTDRRAARPRMEGESDRAYEIRTAPSRFAAETLLKGRTLGGLRAFARAEGVVTTSSDSKTGLVERLMRALYDRHADSEAITRMVNRDRTPAPAVPAAPRSNTPPASGPITPTMTGSQLLAQRRASRPKA